MTRMQRWGALATVAGLTTSLMLLGAAPVYAADLNVCASGCTAATIQGAVDAAAPGDTITVAAGTYAESVTLDKSLTLVGNGATITPPVGANLHALILTAAATDVTITGFTFDLVGAQSTQRFIDGPAITRVTIDDNTFRNGTSASVGEFRLQGASIDVTFTNNALEDGLASNGLWAHATSGAGSVTIVGNMWLDNNGLAMNIGASAGASMTGEISQNWIGNSTEGTGGVDNFGLRQGGMVIAGAFDGLRIEGNLFQDIEDAVVSIWTGFSGSASIINNAIDGYSNVAGYAAIYVRPTSGGTPSALGGIDLSGNTFDNPTTGSRAVVNQPDTGELNAQFNWWGQASGPDSGQIDQGAGVLVDPWLASPDGAVLGIEIGEDPIVSFENMLPGNPTIKVDDATYEGTGNAWIEATVLAASDLPAGTTPFNLDGAILVDLSVKTDGDLVANGPYTVCFDAAVGQKLWHHEGGAWVDITNRVIGEGTITPVSGKVCGMVNDFSPFAVAAVTPALAATGADTGVAIGSAALAGLLLLLGVGAVTVARARRS